MALKEHMIMHFCMGNLISHIKERTQADGNCRFLMRIFQWLR